MAIDDNDDDVPLDTVINNSIAKSSINRIGEKRDTNRAKGRWNILRDAILRSSRENTCGNRNNKNNRYSIHNFIGYQMIPSPKQLQLLPKQQLPNDECTTKVSATDDDDDDAIRIRQIMERYQYQWTMTPSSLYCFYRYTIPTSIFTSINDINNHVHKNNNGSNGVVTDTNDDDGTTTLNNTEELMRQLPVVHVYTREKQFPGYMTTSVQELVRHHHPSPNNNSHPNENHPSSCIDNTGNICVWDCERTLCWFLLSQHGMNLFSNCIPVRASSQPPPPPASFTHNSNKHTPNCDVATARSTTAGHVTTILELGCGMAGLASLSVAAAIYNATKNNQNAFNNHQLEPQAFHFYLTDGNIDCVQNNQINVDLMRTMNVLPPPPPPPVVVSSSVVDDDKSTTQIQIDCCQLLWSFDYPIPSSSNSIDDCTETITKIRADLTLVSDCIHFEQYHGELLWTLVTHTKGTVMLCQPDRAPSLSNFIEFINHVNITNTTNLQPQQPLVHMMEHVHDEIEAKHNLFMIQQQQQTQDDDSYFYYDPDKHRPRIFRMDILRAPNDIDRQRMMDFCGTKHAKSETIIN